MLTLIALSTVLMQEPPAPPTPPEVRSRLMVMGPHGPGSLDRDGDGHVSRQEFAAPMNEHFARMDKDGDGRLSAEELAGGHGPGGGANVMVFHGGAHGAPGGRRFEMRGPHPAGEAGGREVSEVIVLRDAPGHGMPHIAHRSRHGGAEGETRFEIRHMGAPGGHAEMDKDGDGRISEAEFTAPLREAFARMDADGSGFIEEGERSRDREVRVFTHCIETRDED